MRIVITGGEGFVGKKLAARLLADGEAVGPDGARHEITEVVLFDKVTPYTTREYDTRITRLFGDIAERADVEALIAPGTASVFHLAAVVSAAAEADLDLGLAVNLDGTRHVLDACRKLPTPPKLVFASSVAVYGGDPPPRVDDATPPAPRTSYGAQKACGELLVSDYSRRGVIDGRSVRLPTIVVRPGRPNKAASTWASSILREPLAGQQAICPVEPETVMPILSPRRLIDSLIAVHDAPRGPDYERALLLPSISVSVSEMIEGLRRAGGNEAVARVRFEPDPIIQRIVAGWPAHMEAKRAERLGLKADASIDEIIQAFIEDDLPSQKALAAQS